MTHKVDDVKQRQVEQLAALGLGMEEIASVLFISIPTLRKHYWTELQRGRLTGRARNTKRLNDAAAKGNVTAMIWLDKTRFGVPDPDSVPKKAQIEADARSAGTEGKWAGLLQ